MRTTATPRFHEWRVAQAAAAEAERHLFRAHIAFARGAAPLPPPHQEERAGELRREATRLFGAALAEMERIADALRAR